METKLLKPNEETISLACELLKRGGGLFGSAEKTGSIGVITINLARLGYIHRGNREGLFREFVSFVNDEEGTPIYENTYQYAILKKEWKQNNQ